MAGNPSKFSFKLIDKLSNLFDSNLKIEEKISLNECIENVRKEFLKLYELNPENYDECDTKKVKENDYTVRRFVLWNDLDDIKALRQLDDAMKWRKLNEVNIRGEKDAPIEFFKAGAIYHLGEDKNGLRVIYFRVKTVLKIKKLRPIYNMLGIGIINRIDEEINGSGFTCVMDLHEVGLKNADLELIHYAIDVLRKYFPLSVTRIIIYNTPWYLKGFIPIVKMWLSDEEQELLKFASKSEIFDYIDKEQVPKYMGGNNGQDFTIVPEGCKPVEDLAELYGFTREEARKYMKKYEPHIIEGQKLAKNLITYSYIKCAIDADCSSDEETDDINNNNVDLKI